MSITLTRREILQFVGGSALGLLFTPIPWKVLNDSAIWTQNWPWIPAPLTGEFTSFGTTCTLCQSACGMRARSVGKQPVSLSGIPGHPFNNGSLCTAGILAHHLRYHPSRLRQPIKFLPGTGYGTPLSSTTVVDEISRCLNGNRGPVVILDGRPGRTASALFGQLGEAHPAVRYIPMSAPAFDVLHTMSDAPLGPLGYDIDGARLLVNFGAPLFDAWGTPSRASKVMDTRASKTQTVIHVEALCSRSASRSDQWIAARPGSEALLALSLACVMIEEKLYSAAAARTIGDFGEFSDYIRTFSPEAVSGASGVRPETIRTTARAFASQSPALAIVGNDASYETCAAVMALNILAGTVGHTGGVARRNAIPDAAVFPSSGVRAVSLHDVPDHSICTLIIDESLSGCTLSDALLEKKLVPKDATIISLSPFVTSRPYCTQYVVPSTVMFETMSDVPGPIDAAVSSLAVSAAVLQAPDGMMDAVQFAQMLGRALGSTTASGTTEELVKQRVAAIHASKRGTVFAPSTGVSTALQQCASADELWSALAEGGCWMDDAARGDNAPAAMTLMNAFRAAQISLPQSHNVDQLFVVPFAETTIYNGTPVSPLLSKVSQESGLRLSLRQAYVNPATAMARSVANGETISLTTKNGSMTVQAKVDASVMPDVIFVSIAGSRESSVSAHSAHDVRLLCNVNENGSFSSTPVSLQKVTA